MKYIVIILLLSTSGVERIELQLTKPNCEKVAEKWRKINTTYHDSQTTDHGQQGNYTHDGRLMIGYICD